MPGNENYMEEYEIFMMALIIINFNKAPDMPKGHIGRFASVRKDYRN